MHTTYSRTSFSSIITLYERNMSYSTRSIRNSTVGRALGVDAGPHEADGRGEEHPV